jgi:Zn ribbon nucleic-acid-binding protein
MKSIYLNGTRYTQGSKCPCCSVEIDKGGRLALFKRKNYFLKCEKCKYTVKDERVREKQFSYLKRMDERRLGIR